MIRNSLHDTAFSPVIVPNFLFFYSELQNYCLGCMYRVVEKPCEPARNVVNLYLYCVESGKRIKSHTLTFRRVHGLCHVLPNPTTNSPLPSTSRAVNTELFGYMQCAQGLFVHSVLAIEQNHTFRRRLK
jgi:hypothetical protein